MHLEHVQGTFLVDQLQKQIQHQCPEGANVLAQHTLPTPSDLIPAHRAISPQPSDTTAGLVSSPLQPFPVQPWVQPGLSLFPGRGPGLSLCPWLPGPGLCWDRSSSPRGPTPQPQRAAILCSTLIQKCRTWTLAKDMQGIFPHRLCPPT